VREDSGAAAGLTSLPSGGGGVAPLGDRFEPDLVRGSGSYAVPLHLPPGPNELSPKLGLSYSTGSGNGPFGLGWRLGLPRIERRTDRGGPTYDDAADTFVLGDAEELVPVGGSRYRPRTDANAWLIEREGPGWKVQTGEGTTLRLGQTDASRETDGGRVFAWHIDQETDSAGNTIRYRYRRDGGRLYPDEVAWSTFRLRFGYEERADVLRNGRAGFLRVTALRANAIDLFADRADPPLLRTYHLSYVDSASGGSLLSRVDLSATLGGETSAMPSLTFDYTGFDPTRWSVDAVHAQLAPPGPGTPGAQWVDLTGDGLPDLLWLDGTRPLLWRNRGDGWLDGPNPLPEVPGALALSRPSVAFADLDGNGRVDLFAVDQPLALAYAGNGRGGFAADPVVFTDRPDLRLADATTRLTDVDGDGVTDLLATGRSALLWYRHESGRGWQEPQAIPRVHDLDHFPDVTFGDRGVRLADLTGDGLEDIVLLTGDAAWYWPNLGRGQWGDRVELEPAPALPPGYRDERLVLCDLDGDGCADVAYLDGDRVLIWLNRAGAGLSGPFEVPVAPPPQAAVLCLDVWGDGRPGFAWGSPATTLDDAGWRVLRFDPGATPNLLTTVDNGMGRRLTLSYSTSSTMRVADRAVGPDWPGLLPFVVPVVAGITDADTVTGSASHTTIRYHDGVYDGPRRELRGFSRVEVDLAGDESIPASRQEHTFFQGDPEHPDPVERDRQRALAGTPVLMRSSTVEDDGSYRLLIETTQSWDVVVEPSPGGTVYRPHLVTVAHREAGVDGAPDRIDATTYAELDQYGNVTRTVQEWSAAGAPPAEIQRVQEKVSYLGQTSPWLVKLPARRVWRDGGGAPFHVELYAYDGPAFLGLAEGSATAGLLTRTRALGLLAAALPAGYAADADLAGLGYERLGSDDTAGWYANTFSVQRDARGNVVGRADPMGRRSTVGFDPDGVYPIRATDARGLVTVADFDVRAGMPSRVSYPDGRSYRFSFDPLGRQLARFDLDDAGAEQLVTAWRVGVASVPTSITTITARAPGLRLSDLGPDLSTATGVAVSTVYLDGGGRPALTVATGPDAPGGGRRFIAAGRSWRNARGLVATAHPPISAPGLGFPPRAPVPDAALTHSRYDGRGNLIETVGPDPVHVRALRNTFTLSRLEGRAAADPGGMPARMEHFDARGRIVRIDERADAGTTITTRYDLTVDGRLEVLRDGSGGAGVEVARWTYAGPAEAVRVSHRDAGTRTYYRDAAGLIRRMIAADGGELRYDYDTAGRLVRIDAVATPGAAPSTVRSYAYDEDPDAPFATGRLVRVTEPGLRLSYQYDRAGHGIAETVDVGGATLTVRREFDLTGDPIAVLHPDGHRVQLDRDDSGTVRQVPGYVTGIAYEDDRSTAGYRLGNGVTVSSDRDPISRRLRSISAVHGPEPLRRLDYRYDPVGNITGLDDIAGPSTTSTGYDYDGLHRLRGFQRRDGGTAGPVTQSGLYPIDPAGNLLGLAEAGQVTLTYADTAHPGRVTATADPTQRPVSYDGRGRITAFGSLTRITYDAFDRVTEIEREGGDVVRFVPDHQGRIVARETHRGAAVARTRYAGGCFEQHDDRTVRHIFLGPIRVASETTPAAGGPAVAAYFLVDHHGTAILATNASGAVTAQQRYTAFGQALAPAADLDRFLGTDAEIDVGLVALGARFYAPGLGRFLSPDWWVLENPEQPMRVPQGYHLYSYGMNNPLRFDDPGGRWFFLPFIVGFVVGLLYGYADGRDADGSWSLAKETALTTGIGFNLGWMVGNFAPLVGGSGLAGVTGAMGGLNGLFTGTRQIYDSVQFLEPEGLASLVADSSWGILGTTLGNAVNVYNLLAAPSSYRADLSRGQNRQVYDRGFALKGTFAFTQGNVTSNMAQGGASGGNTGRLLHHESLHIFQNRAFGPLFQLSYVAWVVVGGVIGAVASPFVKEDFGKAINDVAYDDNPWEYWAYQHGGGDSKAGKLSYL
jgi:RHS repeat-associated protein